MNQENRWLLPAGIDELLPDAAWASEALRRRLLDLFRSWGYELVIPPMVEYVESLLIHPGDDLDLSTLKVIDQLTGRLMGVRADMTPQMARIDAHSLGNPGVTRLCYLGTVVHALPGGFGGARTPMQVGAELFGHAGLESDHEIISLMLEMLHSMGVHDVWFDLGHVGISRAVIAQAGLNVDDESEFFALLQRKALPDIRDFLAARALPETLSSMLAQLAQLHGDGLQTLARARALLAGAGESVLIALDEVETLARRILDEHAGVRVHVDLAELRGYHYHTGMVFAAYAPGQRQAIVRGGRYDGIGEAFGRARPATGFSADVRALLDVMSGESTAEVQAAPCCLAPAVQADEPGYEGLRDLMRTLRGQGWRVVQALPGGGDAPQDDARRTGYTHCIEPDMTHTDEFWKVREI